MKFLILGLLVSIQAVASAMQTIPIERKTWHPRTFIQSLYQSPTSQVVMNITTKMATLNLDNFLQIIAIDCSTSTILIEFDSEENSQMAYQKWQYDNGLVFFLGHEHRCMETKSISTRLVLDMELTGRSLIAHTEAIHTDQVVGEYDLRITQIQDKPDTKPAAIIDNSHSIEKRDATQGNETYHNMTIPLNINYSHGKVMAPRIYMAPANYTGQILEKVICWNCYSNGTVTIGIHVVATKHRIKEYNVTMDGIIHVNADLEVTVSEPNLRIYRRKTIGGAISLSPIMIPGILILGPLVRLDVMSLYGITAAVKANFGFDVTIPFKMQVSSKHGLLSKPTISHSIKPVFHEHAMNVTKKLTLSAYTKLAPIFKFGLHVLDHDPFGLTFSFDNALMADLGMPRCSGDKADLRMLHQHSVSFEIMAHPIKYATNLIDSGKMTLNCTRCSTC